MNGWKTVKLREVATIDRSSIQPEQIENGTVYVGLEHIESGGSFIGIEHVDAGVLASTKFQFTEHHVLYGKLRPYLAKIACPEFNGICSTDILPILPSPKIERRYLFHFLRQPSMIDYASSLAVGANLPRLSPSVLEEFLIPLPPLEEQKRIVDILDRAEALRAKRRAILVQLDELTQSIFVDMFGDPVENPKNWNVEKVQYVISEIEAGWSANGESRPREKNEYAVLKVSAVTQGVFLPEECKVINNNIEFKKIVTPEKEDVLFSRANTLELVGASCLIRENYPYLLLPDKLWKIKVNQEKICPEYFKFILSHPTIRHEISKRSTGTSGSMYNISMEKFRQIDITVPPIEIQKKFSIIIGKIEKIKQSQQQSLLELNNLFDSLSHEAFTGKLFSHQFFEQKIENGVKI